VENFADRLIQAIEAKQTPCIVGLDPRLHLMPTFIIDQASQQHENTGDVVREAIASFHRRIIEVVADLTPAVKLQIAFYEQYGIAGLQAFVDTVALAKQNGLLVIVDAKRNDIAATAEAYANSLLGRTDMLGTLHPIYDVDCITVSPYLGSDSLAPFVKVCAEYGKGIFVLVKTSNPGSCDLQDKTVGASGEPLYLDVARLVATYADQLVGARGYSSIGAVVGATFPSDATTIRSALPHSIFLVPGYGAQGGTAETAMPCFNADGLGAIINASRSITYGFAGKAISPTDFDRSVAEQLRDMVTAVREAMRCHLPSGPAQTPS